MYLEITALSENATQQKRYKRTAIRESSTPTPIKPTLRENGPSTSKYTLPANMRESGVALTTSKYKLPGTTSTLRDGPSMSREHPPTSR